MTTNFLPSLRTPLSKRLQCLTLTGVDEGVPIEALYEISRRFPFVEFGVLYSTNKMHDPRYPPASWFDALTKALRANPGPRMALHVCGAAVGDLIAGQGHVSRTAFDFPRVQLNITAGRYPAAGIRSLLKRRPEQVFITQNAQNAQNVNNSQNIEHAPRSSQLWEELADLPNHAVLFDASSGNGIAPSAWQGPLDARAAQLSFKYKNPVCGYAGGLGPENIERHLRAIDRLNSKKEFWLDMETRIRIDNKFDLPLALSCLEKVSQMLGDTQGQEYPAKPSSAGLPAHLQIA